MPGIKLKYALDDIFKTINQQAAASPATMGLPSIPAYSHNYDDDFHESFSHDIDYSIKNPGHTYAADTYTPISVPQDEQVYNPANFGGNSGNDKWWIGDQPTYAESVAQLIRVRPNLTDQQFVDITAQLDAMKTDPTSWFYHNWYETATSPFVNDIAARGIDVSGGIDDDWIAKNQHLLSGARRTDTGAIAKPTTKGTTAEWLAYDYAQIVQNWGSTKEVLNEEAALKKEIDYWVGRDDLNLSDEQILEQLDWKGKYKYLQGLKDAQSTGKRYNYTQPIDYNPDNLRGYIWAARNNGGSGNPELDAVSAALGRGNVWQENKEISDKLDFKSDAFSPYSVKSTLDDAAQYFGVKEFEPGWAEKAAKTKIDWNNPDDVKYWQQVYNAESFTEQAETEVKEIYDRIDTMIAAGITDPAVIEDDLWDKGLDGSAALSALKKLDASMVRPDKLEGTTRPIDYRKQDVLDYINQQCAKVGGKETLPEFGQQMGQVLNADNSPAPVQPSFSPTPAPTQGPAATVGGSQPAGMPRATENILNTPAPSSTPASVKPTPTPAPSVDQTAQAVNTAQSKIIMDHAKTILATGTPDEKMVLNLAPTANAEGVAADMAGNVQNGTADAAALYDQALKQSRDYVAGHYFMAKQTVKQHEDMQSQLAALQEQYQALIQQRDQMQEQMDFGIVPNIDQTEVEINGEVHVFTADYDTVNKRYIIHDSNPTDDPEVEAEKAQYDIDLRSNMNMENYYAERSYDQHVRIDNLNAQLRVLGGDIERAETTINGHQKLYDQAQEDIKTSKSSIDAVAALEVQRFNPGVDLTSDAGKEALEEAKARVGRLANEIDLAMDIGSKYKATEWSSTTVFDEMLSKGKTIEETAKAADEIIAEADQRLDALKQSKADLKSAGVNLPGEYNSNIDREISYWEKQKQEAEDFNLRARDDFDQVVADAKKRVLADGKSDLVLYAVDPSLDQAENTLADNLSMLAQAGNVNLRDAVQPHKKTYMEYLTPEERDTIIYKWATEGEKAAWDYYNRLGDAVDVRRTNAQNEELAKFAKDMPVLATITSIGLAPDTAKAALYGFGSIIAGQEPNPYNKFYDSTWAVGTLRKVSKEKLLEPLEEGSILRTIASIGYDAATGGADSLVNTATNLPLAVIAPAGKILKAATLAIPMAIRAAGGKVQEVKLNHGSNLQAAIMGGIEFASNIIEETVTTNNILDAVNAGESGASVVGKILRSDAIEEGVGGSLGQIIGGISDTLVMGELSERANAIAKYEQTMSHEEAVKQANKDFWRDVLMAGITEGLSAAGSSAAGFIGGKISSIGTNTNTTQPSVEGQIRATALANGLPLDRTTQDMTARTVTLLTSSLNAGKGSQVQALSAALFPVSGDAQGQRAAVSAGLHLANRMGTEQAVAVAQDVILAAAQEGADQQAVKSAMTVAALGQGEASAVLNRISQNGVEFGDVQALTDAAARDVQNPAIAGRMNAIIHNDRVASRTRDLIGQGALNGVKPYEQAYSQAKAQEAQSQQALETEQERAQVIGENLKTVQGQHAADPANQALAGAMKQAVKDVAGQVKVVGEYQQGLENQQKKTQEAEKDLSRVREEAMTKVREQAMADVQAEEQAEAQATDKKIFGEMNGRKTFWLEGEYSILPNGGKENFVKFMRPVTDLEQAAMESIGLEYDDLADMWFGDVPFEDIYGALSEEKSPVVTSAQTSTTQDTPTTNKTSSDTASRNLRGFKNGEVLTEDYEMWSSKNGKSTHIRFFKAPSEDARDALKILGMKYNEYQQWWVPTKEAMRRGVSMEDVQNALDKYDPSYKQNYEKLHPETKEASVPTRNQNAGTVYTNDQGAEQPVEGLRGGQVLEDGNGQDVDTDLSLDDLDDTENVEPDLSLDERSGGNAENNGEDLNAQQSVRGLTPDGRVDTGDYVMATVKGRARVQFAKRPSQGTIEALLKLGLATNIEGKMFFSNDSDLTYQDIQNAIDNADPSYKQKYEKEHPDQAEQAPNTRRGFVMDAKTNNVPTLTANVPESALSNDQTENLPDQYTYTMEMPSAVPPVNGPGATIGGQPNNGPMRHFNAETGQKSDIFFDSVKKHLIETGALTRDKNSEQINRATEWVRSHANDTDTTGYYGALVEAQSPDFNALSVDGQARVYVLAAMAGMQNDVGAQMALADILTNSRTESGRALQFGKVYTLMSPMGRIAALQKVEAQINDDFARRSKKPIKLSEDTIRAASEAKTQEEFDAVRAKAQKELAAQIPTDWKGKLQAYRIWSMLSGPRTHFRNFFGNAMFIPAVALKNVIGTGLEATIGKGLNMQERTKSLTVRKENRAFAKQDAVKMQDVLTGEAKYTDKQKVLQNRKLFGTKDTALSKTVGKAMQWLMDKNSTALEKEDWFYLKRHYASALGQWMQANKVTPETITAEQLNKARDYAVNEAQKATYRDASEFASTLSKIVNKGGFFGWAVDTANPFRKTPTNIMKRGIEYSPIGLIKTLATDKAKLNNYNNWVENGAKGQKPKNAISPNQYIDNLASGLSGTALTALGYALAKMGFVTVKLDDDEDEFDERAGKQNYGINISIGGVDFSYTMDWAAPSSLPFFVGASLYKATQEEDWDAGKVTDALLEILDPMFDLSMLDGLNSLFENSQWSGTTSLGQIGEKLVTNYANSFIPSFVGAVSRTIDPVRRRNYVESGASLSTWKYAFEQAQNKTPYSVSNIPYRDVWGKEDRSPWMMAAFENFVSPGYISRIKPEKVDEELRKLYDETKEKTVIPKAASKTAIVNGQSIKLNAEQYDKLVVSRGGTAKSILEELMSRPEWLVWNADQKIDMISDVWSYANATATAELFPELKLSSWVKEARRGGKAADVIVKRSEEKAKKEYVDGHKEALFKAVDDHDVEAFNTSMFALNEADKKDKEEQGKKPNPAYAHNLLVNHYKPLYIEALYDDDPEVAETIRDNLLSMPMTGIDAKTILSWQYEAEKQKAK